MSAGLSVFVVVVIIVVGWFALGTHANVRKGHRFLDWLQSGLPLLGEKTTLQWLGSSVVHLKIEKAQSPFRRAEVLIVLEPRDVPHLWLLSRLRGRRDLLVVRTELRTVPKIQVEIFDPRAWSTRTLDQEVRKEQWQLVSGNRRPYRIYSLSPLADFNEIISDATMPGFPLVRLGVRGTSNALELQWHLTSRPLPSARMAFEAVQRVAQRV
jgi:hypothetical protein